MRAAALWTASSFRSTQSVSSSLPRPPSRCVRASAWAAGVEMDYPLHQHVVPLGDLREHVFEASCWCRPRPDEEEPFVLIHNALDGREAYEEGHLQLQ